MTWVCQHVSLPVLRINGCGHTYMGVVRIYTFSAGPSFIPRHLTNESCDSSNRAIPSTSCSWRTGAIWEHSPVFSKYFTTSAILQLLTSAKQRNIIYNYWLHPNATPTCIEFFLLETLFSINNNSIGRRRVYWWGNWRRYYKKKVGVVYCKRDIYAIVDNIYYVTGIWHSAKPGEAHRAGGSEWIQAYSA